MCCHYYMAQTESYSHGSMVCVSNVYSFRRSRFIRRSSMCVRACMWLWLCCTIFLRIIHIGSFHAFEQFSHAKMRKHHKCMNQNIIICIARSVCAQDVAHSFFFFLFFFILFARRHFHHSVETVFGSSISTCVKLNAIRLKVSRTKFDTIYTILTSHCSTHLQSA